MRKTLLVVALIVGMPLVWYATYRWIQGPLPDRPGEIHMPQDVRSAPVLM
jgi:hypothetical protein